LSQVQGGPVIDVVSSIEIINYADFSLKLALITADSLDTYNTDDYESDQPMYLTFKSVMK